MRIQVTLIGILLLAELNSFGQSITPTSNVMPANGTTGTLYVGSGTLTTHINKASIGGSLKLFNTGNNGINSPSLYLVNTTATTGRKYYINSSTLGALKIFDSLYVMPRFMIDSTGKVGIGTDLPFYRMDLSGAIRARSNGSNGINSPSLYLSNSTASTGRNYFLNSDPTGLFQIVDSNAANAARFVINSSGNIGMGTTAPNASSILDITSTTKGFLPPRMTAAQRLAIASPAASLFVWDTDSLRFMAHNGTAWKGLRWTSDATAGSGISSLNGLTGGTQTFATGTSGTDFNISSVGTAHTFNLPDASLTNRGLITNASQTLGGLKTFNEGAIINAGTAGAMPLIIRGAASQTAPYLQLQKSDGTVLASIRTNDPDNLFMGFNAGNATLSQIYNVGIGSNVFPSLTTGTQNVAMGSYAMNTATIASYNTAIGVNALRFGPNSTYSVAIGNAALISSNSYSNTGIGASALNELITGINNTGIGGYTQRRNQSGNSNVSVGDLALNTNISGNENIGIGFQAGFSTLGSGNIFIGTNAGYNETGSNKLYIANSNATNPLIKGDFSTGNVTINSILNLGIAGTASGQLKFTGNSSGTVTLQPATAAGTWTMTLPSTAGTTGQVLTTDGNGVTSWAAAAGGGSSLWTDAGAGNIYSTTLSGNIGIGTINPTEKLHLYGTNPNFFIEGDANSYAGGIRIKNQVGDAIINNYGITNHYFGLMMHTKNPQNNLRSQIGITPGGAVAHSLDPGATPFKIVSAPYHQADIFRVVKDISTTNNGVIVESPVVVVNKDGNVGIGTTAPGYSLDVNGDMVSSSSGVVKGKIRQSDGRFSAGPGGVFFTRSDGTGITDAVGIIYNTNNQLFISGSAIGVNSDSKFGSFVGAGNGVGFNFGLGALKFLVNDLNTESARLLANGNFLLGTTTDAGYKLDVAGTLRNTTSASFATTSGNVAIGNISTFPTGYKLAVAGDVIAAKVKVQQTSGWADYVFEPTYKLPSLKEVEQFIKENKHLPDVPSATEIEKNGLDLGDGQAVLLKKIEEMTLYMIEMNKKIEKLQEENELMKKKLEKTEGK